MIVCIHENRRSEEPGLRLLICSLAQNSPDVRVALFVSNMSDEFLEWASDKVNIIHKGEALAHELYWNVKPTILKFCLCELGFSEVVWLDADLFVTGNLTDFFSRHAPDGISATQETRWSPTPHDDNALRCRLWGLVPGRFHPFALNSCVVRVGQQHVELLTEWEALLASEEYQNARNIPVEELGPHLFTDQDILTALLASNRFSKIPVDYIYLGDDIVHCFGLKAFTLADRFKWILNGAPTFIHAQRNKPWSREDAGKPAIQRFYDDLLPNVVWAPKILAKCSISENWTKPRTKYSAASRFLCMNYPPLIGIFFATFFDAKYWAAKQIKALYRR